MPSLGQMDVGRLAAVRDRLGLIVEAGVFKRNILKAGVGGPSVDLDVAVNAHPLFGILVVPQGDLIIPRRLDIELVQDLLPVGVEYGAVENVDLFLVHLVRGDVRVLGIAGVDIRIRFPDIILRLNRDLFSVFSAVFERPLYEAALTTRISYTVTGISENVRRMELTPCWKG